MALHYFPRDQDPGMTSVGGRDGLEAGGITNFYINSIKEMQQIPNEMAIFVSLAMKAANEFFLKKDFRPI